MVFYTLKKVISIEFYNIAKKYNNNYKVNYYNCCEVIKEIKKFLKKKNIVRRLVVSLFVSRIKVSLRSFFLKSKKFLCKLKKKFSIIKKGFKKIRSLANSNNIYKIGLRRAYSYIKNSFFYLKKRLLKRKIRRFKRFLHFRRIFHRYRSYKNRQRLKNRKFVITLEVRKVLKIAKKKARLITFSKKYHGLKPIALSYSNQKYKSTRILYKRNLRKILRSRCNIHNIFKVVRKLYKFRKKPFKMTTIFNFGYFLLKNLKKKVLFRRRRVSKFITRVGISVNIRELSLSFDRTTFFSLMFLYSFCKFRYNDFTLIVRHNHMYRSYLTLKKELATVILAIRFPRHYKTKLLSHFTFMCFTKEVNRFSVFIKHLLEKIGRVGQKNFFHTFNMLGVDIFLSVLKKHQIVGFYLRAVGKIAGYAGDRTRLFLIRYGSCSRSHRSYAFSYYQNVAFTKPGAIGINTMLAFTK